MKKQTNNETTNTVTTTIAEVTINNEVVFDAAEFNIQVNNMTVLEAQTARNEVNEEIKILNTKREELRTKRAKQEEEYKLALAAIAHLKDAEQKTLTEIRTINTGYAELHTKKNIIVGKLDLENLRLQQEKLKAKQAKLQIA